MNQSRDGHLLSGGVQDVEETRLAIDDDLLPVAVLDGGVVLVHKMVLDQLDGQGGLANTARCKMDSLVLIVYALVMPFFLLLCLVKLRRTNQNCWQHFFVADKVGGKHG